MSQSDRDHAQGLRRERMAASPRFTGGKFRNLHAPLPEASRSVAMPSVVEFLRGRAARRPSAPLPALDPREALHRAHAGLRVTWLGHSTMLLELDGKRFLTDPVWGERLSPVPFVAPRRFQPVPIAIAALPPIDAVLISHDHFDHLDKPSIVQLVRAGAPLFVVPLGVGAHLERWGVPAERITELDFWEELQLGDVRIVATPCQHFSGRGLGANATAWTSFAVRGPRHSFFYSGDTGLTTELKDIRARLGAFDLVMLEVGAFHPAWGDIHLGPLNALTALDWLGGGAFLPVHWGTFDLGLHPWDEPVEALLELAPKRDVQLLLPRLGEPLVPAQAQALAPKAWWRDMAQQAVPAEAAAQDSPSASELLVPLD
ncbi:MAG: hypothetical protein RL385_2064 [Pseudomonadota bacterium]|jgi:L-ascorbate metabolism protein UlaG (beta-lactamase superfamily)